MIISPKLDCVGEPLRVSVVLPTFNESANIKTIIAAIHAALGGTRHYEIIVVDDDSPDGTWQLVDEISSKDRRVQCVRRIDKKGLASAIIDGLSLGNGAALVVMDADLQHDPSLLPAMIASLDNSDITIASRYVEGGTTGSWGGIRLWGSRTVTMLSRYILGIKATDPLSGFFAIRRELFQAMAADLRPRGFKALLDILVHAPGAIVHEIPLRFGERHGGKSKLGISTVFDLCCSLIELRTGHILR
jgi:dolichol-phosphate mannosyltransferase